MERLLKNIEGNAKFIASIEDCEKQITPILQKFITNFPDYTDHSIVHSKDVLKYISFLVDSELEKLNEDEIYILVFSGLLHDIGMCPTDSMKSEILKSSSFIESKKSFEHYLRTIHHEVSYNYIMTHWRSLKIINETYAEAIALVSMGHRVTDLFDFEKYEPDFLVKSGSETVCLPYLAGILRLADELDITNDRTPDLLYNEYFPENLISKLEWEKHKANYFVNFSNDTIKIRSKCFNKELYFALIKQYNKIEEVQKYIQKLVRIIPKNDRNLQLKYSKLDKDIKTNGFIPKEIGFSFDLQNTIDTFIGDNIYNNKNVAIRECIQNSIDSCRYRKQLLGESFSPNVKIILHNNNLKIIDNGVGMDDFIVENYFAKLAKSYYTEKKIQDSFEAISQFGVGVFSYFLLCEYFEVESKMDGREPIKFLANKDADSYFHFSDSARKESIGTEVNLILRDKLSIENIINTIKHYFRHVEFPIEVSEGNRVVIVENQSFVLDKDIDLRNICSRRSLEELEGLEIIDVKIETDEYQGVLGIIMHKDVRGTFTPSYISYDIFESINSDLVELSHKGVYVNQINSHSLPFKWTIGKLNLKRKKALDIGRYHIKNSNDITKICNDFYSKIFEKIFKSWRKRSKNDKVKLTANLLDNYFNTYAYTVKFNEDLLDLLSSNLYFRLFAGAKNLIVNLNELKERDEFIIMNSVSPFTSDRKINDKDIKGLYKHFNETPIVVIKQDYVGSDLFSLIHYLKWPFEIVSNEKHWYVKVNKHLSYIDFCDRKLLNRKYDACIHDCTQIASNPKLDTSRFFNISHPIIKYILGNEESINTNPTLLDLFDKFLYLVSDFLFYFHNWGIKDTAKDIQLMNDYLSKINDITSTSFSISESDFADWINEKIDWK